MKGLLALVSGTLLALPAFAQSAADYCAKARDPARCEARQAALKTCRDRRGAERRACLEANMPPVDCSKVQNPQRCEAAQTAKEVCREKSGREMEKCLREEQQRKSSRQRQSGG